MSAHSPKQYPTNEVYSHSPKPTFQQASKNKESKNVVNISGTSLTELSYSSKSNKNSPQEIAILHERIQYLQKELEMVTQLLMEEEPKREVIDRLQKQNKQLKENYIKCEQMNSMLQNQIAKSQINNQQLLKALNIVNDELEALKKQGTDSKKSGENVNDSKASMKSKEEVQQDIIRLNEEISNVLSKMHILNQDYELVRQRNSIIEKEKQQMILKISNLQQNLSEALNRKEKYKNDVEYAKQQILLLKQEIQQVNQLSIKKQKQLQDQYYEKQKYLAQQFESMKTQLNQSAKEQSNKQVQQGSSSQILEIKNVRIRALELDNQFLKSELQMFEQKGRKNNDMSYELERQLNDANRKLQQINQNQMYLDKIKILERSSQNKISSLEDQLRELKNSQNKSNQLEDQLRDQRSELRNKQDKIYELEEQIRLLKRSQYTIQSLQQQIKELRNRQYSKNEEYSQVERKKAQVSQQLDQVKRKLEQVQGEVRNTNQVKDRYGAELASLKQKMRELTQFGQERIKQIREIESDQSNSKKKIQDVSIISELTHNQKYQQLQITNKELQKMLLNEKIQKENQNKRYRQLLQDYKQLNEEMSTQLQLYRDAQSIDHPMCPLPLKDSRERTITIIPKKYSERSEAKAQIKAQLEKQKSRYHNLLQKYEKTIERYKGVELKISHFDKIQRQAHFLKIDNSSIRSQVDQLNIRIEEYKDAIQGMRREAEIRGADADKLRLSIQREYQAKMQVQRMEIINQYNVLLRNRNVRVQPTQFKPTLNSLHQNRQRFQSYQLQYQTPKSPVRQETFQDYQARYHGRQEGVYQTSDIKIRYHPEYKKLQQEYMKIHRQLLQSQQAYNKSLTEYRDEIQKLKIENQYHRKTVDELHAQGYGIYAESGREGEAEHYKNKYEEINRNYHKLYQQYASMKSKSGPNYEGHGHFVPGDKIREILRPTASSQSNYRYNQVDKSELQILKKIIDQKLIQLQITPRDPASIIERAGWLIQKLGSIVIQLRQDRDTIKNQKKQASMLNDKLKVKIQTLQYENSHLLKQLSVAVQKFKYLEDKNLRIANVSFPVKVSDFVGKTISESPRVPTINIENTTQKDVYQHEAGVIRQHRLELLRKFQRQIEGYDKQPL